MISLSIPEHVWSKFQKFVDERACQDDSIPYNRLELGDADHSVYRLIIDTSQPNLKGPVVSVHCKYGHAYFDWQTRQKTEEWIE